MVFLKAVHKRNTWSMEDTKARGDDYREDAGRKRDNWRDRDRDYSRPSKDPHWKQQPWQREPKENAWKGGGWGQRSMEEKSEYGED
eukprot:6771569-Heterocapsa_arctica.AAC.1